MVTKKLEGNGMFLHFPIKNTEGVYHFDKTYHYIKILVEGAVVATFYIKLADDWDFYAPYRLPADGEVTLVCEDDVPQNYFDCVVRNDELFDDKLYPNLYNEPLRPQYHFSPARGWLNDPNGLFVHNGEYNMYYQHNPLGIFHGGVNVSWGHAISPDGVHWREVFDAIYPTTTETLVASGTAIVDTQNKCGFGNDTVVSAHTELSAIEFDGQKHNTRGQFVCISNDGGMTYRYLSDKPNVTVPVGESWRDPKLLQTDDGNFCMAVYETHEGNNCVSFYSSENLLDWTFRSRTPNLYECPDLFPLVCQETGERKWVLYGADCVYRIGDFQDYKFIQQEQGGLLDYGSCYAGQTFNGSGENARLHLAWLSTDCWDKYDKLYYNGKTFSQQMTLVCQLTLHKNADGHYKIYRNPIEGVRALRGEKFLDADVTLNGFWHCNFGNCSEVVAKVSTQKPFRFAIGEAFVVFDPDTKSLYTRKGTAKIDSDELTLDVFIDHSSVEFFVCGEISSSFVVDTSTTTASISGVGQMHITAYTMNKSMEK